MMPASLMAPFLIGLLGGVHCVGMCGGIVSALSLRTSSSGAAHRLTPGAVTVRQPQSPLLHLGYNLGRIFSYGIAGAIAGAVGGLGLMLNDVLPIQIALYALANFTLIALGLYLVGMPALLSPLERAGQWLWKRIQPLTQQFLPARTVGQALMLGGLWGWLPCGLVYSALTLALLSGSAVRGAGVMLAFGVGTLPNLLMAGMSLARFHQAIRNKNLRTITGGLVLGFGVLGLANASTLGGQLWQGIVCHVR